MKGPQTIPDDQIGKAEAGGATLGLTSTIGGRFVLLVMLLLLPAVLLTGLLLWRTYEHEHAAAKRQLSATARALSLVVDRQIGQSQMLIEALSTSPDLIAGNVSAFDGQARRAITDPRRWVVVVQPDGQQLVNTSMKPGALMVRGRSSLSGVTFSQLPGGVRLWDLIMGMTSHKPVVVLAKTVTLHDGRKVELIVSMLASRMRDIFVEQKIPADWTGVVLDAQRRIVARSRSHDLFVGKSASPSMLGLLKAADASVQPTITLDGIESMTAWNRSPLTRWTFIVAVPRDQMAAGARTSLIEGVLLGLVLLGAGLVGAILVSRSMVRAIGQLRTSAAALGDRRPLEPTRSRFAELNAVQASLESASAALSAHEQDLQALNQELEHRVIARTRELAEATESLIQAQKMEAIGRLTGGIAHDFNNLLTAVIGNLDLSERRNADDRIARYLGNARSAADRGARLTAQLLAFSRRQQLRAEPIDVAAAISLTLPLIETSIAPAELLWARGEPLWPALADPTQLDLILLNLAINARDAMPASGRVRIAAANISIAEPAAGAEHPGKGDYVTVTVTDDGTGMPPEIRARIFEPFFTTKGAGQGTGLGLPQVLGILKQLGGGIAVDTAPGRGTAITIYLPRSQVSAPTEAPAPVCDGDGIAGQHILLVDDDPDVRAVTASMLLDLGCRVTEASNGFAGLAALDESANVDFALLDYAMPGLNGAELAARIRARRPALPILLMSGYADAEALAALWSGPLIAKPFTAAMLGERMAAVATAYSQDAG